MSQPTIFKLSSLFRKPYKKFIYSRSGPFKNPITLDRTRVYILPTKSGVIFSILLIVLLVGSVNYNKSLGFVLTFLLVGIGNIALLATWKNLAGLTLSAGGCTPIFSGEHATFCVLLKNSEPKTKYAITVRHKDCLYETIDAITNTISSIHFKIKIQQRGYYDPKQFRLQTEYPMGLFISWTVIDLSMSCLVYPSPTNNTDIKTTNTSENGVHSLNSLGNEEFNGLKKHQDGESWRRISWKTYAKNNELFSKDFTGGQPQLLWINWNDIAADNTEHKLSIITQLVIDADALGYQYGLRLDTSEISPDSGSAHYHRCLKQLALYGNNNDQ